jgi:hypothetical protein
VIRNAVGENKYQRLCQTYPCHTKATRQRLIALDPMMPVPAILADVLKWLANVDALASQSL